MQQPGALPIKIKKLEEPIEGVDDFSQAVDKIIHCYSTKCVGFLEQDQNLPKLGDLIAQKEKVCGLKKHLKLNELHSFFLGTEDNFKISDTIFLCALLGINSEYRMLVDKFEPDMRRHHNELYYIVKNMRSQEDDFETIGQGKTGLSINLMELGFTEERASFIDHTIPEQLIDLQWPSYWAERYLNHIASILLILKDDPRYPYSPEKINQFFGKEISTLKRKEPNSNEAPQSVAINMFNLQTSENENQMNLVNEFIKKAKDKHTDSELFYHTTEHKYAVSILTEGIKLEEGTENQDFSNGNGFYLTENIDFAFDWIHNISKRKKRKNAAIVVFQVNKNLIDAGNEQGLDVTGDKDQWMKIIDLCRYGKGIKATKNNVKKASFIRGPITNYDKKFIQFCIRQEEYAVRFGSLRNILCVLFL